MKKKCYFYLNDEVKCIWGKKFCFFCSFKMKVIPGMETTTYVKDYVNIIISKKHTRRTFFISILALLVSLGTLFFRYIYVPINDNNLMTLDYYIQENYYIPKPSTILYYQEENT